MSFFAASKFRFICALCASLSTAIVASDAIAADVTPPVLIGGTFITLGTPRLAFLSLQNGAFVHAPIRVDGVRTCLSYKTTALLGGSFTTVNNERRLGLARLLENGELDPDWHPAVDGDVIAMAACDDRLYLGGRFTTVDGKAHANLACVSLVDGHEIPWQADTDGAVQALTATNTAVVAGGTFNTVSGQAHIHLARLSPTDGAADPAFIGAADSEVHAVLVRGAWLYLGGQFTRINAEDRLGLARVDLATGSVDPTWRADVDGAVFGFTARNNQLSLVGAFSTVAGQPRTNCAQLDLVSGKITAWQPAPDEQVTAIAEAPDNRILVSGRFTSVEGEASAGIALLAHGDGHPQLGWKPPQLLGSGAHALAIAGETVIAAATAIDGQRATGLGWIAADGSISNTQPTLDGTNPHLMCAVSDGPYLYVGGDFSMIDGLPRVGIARLDRATRKVDATWHCDANGTVRAMAIEAGHVVVGGDFTKLGGQPCSRIGRIAVKDGSVQGGMSPIDGAVMAIVPWGDGVLIAGNFTTIGGVAKHGLARLQFPDGKLDPSFNADLADGNVPGVGQALIRIGSERLAVGGRFTTVGGTAAVNLAVLDATTGTVQPWSGTTDGPVFALALADERLVVGGGFSALGGTPRAHVGIVDVHNGTVTPWQADTDAEVRTIAIAQDQVWLGGDFTTCGGSPAAHLARRRWADAAPLPMLSSGGRVELVLPLISP